MKARLPLLAAASLSILSLAPAQGATPLFTETFAGNAGDWSSSSGAASFDNTGWSCTSVCKSQSAIKLGTGSLTGSATSPSISLPSGWSKALVTVSFQAAAWYGTKNNTTTLSVIENNQMTTNVSWSVPPIEKDKTSALQIADLSSFTADSTGKNYEMEFTTRGSFQLSFETSGSEPRVYLDSVVVVAEEIVSGLTPLPAPSNLSSSDIGYTSFSLSWGAVSGATGYSVTVSPAGTVSVDGTTASVTGLTPGETYTAYVTALGDGTTNDNSDPAELSDITTLASVPLSAPTGLASSNIGYFGFSLSWTAVSGATDYTVTLSPAGSVSVDGTTATATGLSEGVTYTASVVAKGNGIETADSPTATLDVTTATAPAVSAPVLTASGVSPSSFTVSWPAQNDASFSVRAWTLVPANTATEDFAGYPEVEPEGWTFNGTEANTTASAASHPVAFKSSCSMVSPVYPSDISSLSFDLQHGNATSSSFAVFGSDDCGETWTPLVEYSNAGTHISNGEKTISISTPGIRQIKFVYTKSSGNLYLGSFSVTGTDIGKQPSYLTGYGPDPVVVGATSVTISNPVKGEKNYVEVTATGLSGRTATSTLPVFVPGYPAVITVK